MGGLFWALGSSFFSIAVVISGESQMSECWSPVAVWRITIKVSLALGCYMQVKWPLRWSIWCEGWWRGGKCVIGIITMLSFSKFPFEQQPQIHEPECSFFREGIIQHRSQSHIHNVDPRILENGSYFHNFFVGKTWAHLDLFDRISWPEVTWGYV